ncbi:MAG: YceH family protein [Pseudomonadales bacterium]|nr:YceH family protein [Pseudomonadales bacterium]
MKFDLSLYETRVISVLLEKEVTTPDQYPLSLNALKNACNQKSNRHPVLDLDETTVSNTLDALEDKNLIRRMQQGSRVEKFKHRFCNTEFGELKLTPAQLAILCELMLRGAQTPGELRSRASRMAALKEVREVDDALQELIQMTLVNALPREPGKRECRYQHRLSKSTEQPVATQATEAQGNLAAKDAKIKQLEQQVSDLQSENERLIQKLRQLGEVV